MKRRIGKRVPTLDEDIDPSPPVAEKIDGFVFYLKEATDLAFAPSAAATPNDDDHDVPPDNNIKIEDATNDEISGVLSRVCLFSASTARL